MIRYVDSPALSERLSQLLLGEDLLHACFLATYKNARAPGADFWLCENGAPYGALMRTDSGFIFCSGEKPDFAELREFLRFIGCRCLCARLPVLEKLAAPLSLTSFEHAPAMVRRGGFSLSFPEREENIDIRRETENRRPVYELIDRHYEGFDNYGGGPGYDRWLSGMRLRERDGVCGVWGLYINGELVSTASIMSASERCADIGTVVTRKDCRGRGYAARLIDFLCRQLEKSGRLPVLGCANERLQGYYQRLGFTAYDRWAAAEQREVPPKTPEAAQTEEGAFNRK